VGSPVAVGRVVGAFEDRVEVVGRAEGPRCGDESSADGVARAHWESGPLGLELLEPLLLDDELEDVLDESELLDELLLSADLLSDLPDFSDLSDFASLDSPLEPEPEDSALGEGGREFFLPSLP